jgi:hypothetical protein
MVHGRLTRFRKRIKPVLLHEALMTLSSRSSGAKAMTDRARPLAKLLTLAEQSDFHRTGPTDEIDRLCDAYARTWPDAVRSFEYGRSAEGRPMRALIVSRAGALSPIELQRRGIPILMIQAGIHPGESDGKDAGFIALRELLAGSVAPDALNHIAVLFIPAFNTDGHERFGRLTQLNQFELDKLGWGTTAQNLNLNRDYTKAETPEMQAMLGLLGEWDPLICADLHVTESADFQADMSILVEPVHQGDPQLHAGGTRLRNELAAKLTSQDASVPAKPELKQEHVISDFQLTIYTPCYSTGYFPARNRFAVLIETHSWTRYLARVRAIRSAIVALVELTVTHGANLLREALRADTAGTQLGGREVPIEYAASWHAVTENDAKNARSPAPIVTKIEPRPAANKSLESPGEVVTIYDPNSRPTCQTPFARQIEPALVIKAPAGGYIVPVAYAPEIGQKLKLHGMTFERLIAGLGNVDVEAFRATHAEFSRCPFEGRMRVTLDGAWRPEPLDVPPGSLFVPIDQPRARLLMMLLEPNAPDSFAAWGFFNACFEQRGHIEPYAAESVARELLARDRELDAEFNRKLAEESDVVGSTATRLEFFKQRHMPWDQNFNLYPIYRLQKALGKA